MKKGLAILLGLTLVLSMSGMAMAAETAESDGEKVVTITSNVTKADVVSVEVAWDSVPDITYEWDTASRKWKTPMLGGSTSANIEITVTNNSSLAKNIKAEWDSDAGLSGTGLTAGFSNNTLETPTDFIVGDKKSDNLVIETEAVTTAPAAGSLTIGTLTVTIGDATSVGP